MGKHRHSKDKLYIVQTEYARDWGGFKGKSRDVPLRVLPFDCCALSLRPFQNPMCTKEGFVFDLEHILPYLKQHKRNPVNGLPLSYKDLLPIHFHKNKDGDYHCPCTYKVFNPHSHIVVNLKSGNVYSMDAIENLCRKPQHWYDPLDNSPFTIADVIDIQNPHDVTRRRIEKFDYIVKEHVVETLPAKGIVAKDVSEKLRTTPLMQKVLEKASEAEKDRVEAAEKKRKEVELQEQTRVVRKKHKTQTTGRDAQSMTSTLIHASGSGGLVDYREMTELEERELVYAKVKESKEKGYVQFVTTLGPLNIELYCNRAPLACDSFLRHCQSGYYKNTIFHRVIKHFMVQGGDPEGTGKGGESAFGKPFYDEFHPHLRHDSRGVVSMANSGLKHDNRSQFFITFQPAEHLDDKHSVFGHVVGGKDTLKLIENLEIGAKNRPLEPPKIIEINVFKNPFKIAEDALRAEDEI